MSSSSINVQVGALDEAFHPSGPELGLVAAAFLVAYAGLLPDAGRLVDVRGRGPIFIAGVTAFALGSLVCAGAGTIWPGRGVPEGPRAPIPRPRAWRSTARAP
ncbi:MFS transporter [Ruania sp. N2-46]|uniref:MFS transporter n=2 Tax=Occultella gossypii TaxID=2800820 RepID=A0ABS7S9W2_9MICO|nr:MFS transporter [Occultella gossypii]